MSSIKPSWRITASCSHHAAELLCTGMLKSTSATITHSSKGDPMVTRAKLWNEQDPEAKRLGESIPMQ